MTNIANELDQSRRLSAFAYVWRRDPLTTDPRYPRNIPVSLVIESEKLR